MWKINIYATFLLFLNILITNFSFISFNYEDELRFTHNKKKINTETVMFKLKLTTVTV